MCDCVYICAYGCVFMLVVFVSCVSLLCKPHHPEAPEFSWAKLKEKNKEKEKDRSPE